MKTSCATFLGRFSLAQRITVLLAIFAANLLGQATEGSILGTITDSSGAAVPGALVTVTSVQTGFVRTTPTNEFGEYVVTNLPLGSYTVGAENRGFKKALHPAVEITVKARVRVNLQLEVGETTESVNVTAAPPLLKTDTIEVSTVITREQLQSLPIVNRHFLNISVLAPGTVRVPTGRQADLGGDALGVGSADVDQNNFIIDGISNNMEFSGTIGVVPAMDAIQEFSIQTSGYSAEFGKGGGGVVNVAIRSGTNDIHGFAYDYLRNDKLNARPYDFTGTNPAKQPLRRNQFGGGVGLPIIRNRAFVFGNYEGYRQPANVLSYSVVPTPLERQGDFTASRYTIHDPATQRPDPANPSRLIRDPFPGNRLPSSRINPMMSDLVSRYPLPNFTDPNPAVLNNFLAFQRNTDTLNSMNLKSDVLVTSRDTLTGRWSQQWLTRNRQGFMPEDLNSGRGTLDATNAGITHTRVISPSMVNEIRFGFNHLVFGNTLVNVSLITDKFNIPGANAKPGFPNFNIRLLTRPSPIRALTTLPNPFGLEQHSYQFMENVNWHKGRHSIKFGGEFSRHRNDTMSDPPGGIEPIFMANYTTPFAGATREAFRTGMADALLGLSNQWTTYFNNDKTRLKVNRFSAFIQDEWRATRKLSLTLGLRYDLLPKWGELQDRLTGFDLSGRGRILVPDTTRGVLQGLGLPNGDLPATMRYAPLGDVLPKTDFLNFGPRFGFAYSVTDRIVLRGGYGIFYGSEQANFNNNTAGTPFSARIRLLGDLDKPIDIAKGFEGSSYADVIRAPYPAISQMIDLNHPDAYIQKWNFNIQFQPLEKTAIELGYNASRGVAFPMSTRFNFPDPAPGDIQARRPYPDFGEGFGLFYVGDTSYNAFEATVRQQSMFGLSIFSTFTWSKSLGYASDGLMKNTNIDYYRGRLNFDYGRRWVTSFIYKVPAWTSLHKAVRFVIADWEASSIVLLQDGFPFSVRSSQNMNDALDASRANLVLTNGPAELSVGERSINRWFNTTAFAAPPNFVWGNSGVNILNGPGMRQVDFALQKGFPITERARLTFRMEALNFFNSVNLGQPSSTLGAAAFGTIRSTTTDPRIMQVSLRLAF